MGKKSKLSHIAYVYLFINILLCNSIKYNNYEVIYFYKNIFYDDYYNYDDFDYYYDCCLVDYY